MNLIDEYINKVPIYYQDLKIGNIIYIVNVPENSTYNFTKGKQYKVTKIGHMNQRCNLCMTDGVSVYALNDFGIESAMCHIALANKFGKELLFK